MRLFCFSYAGGSAAVFKSWPDAMPQGVEVCSVQLPGRGTRYGETALTSMEQMLDELQTVIRPLTNVPYVFFGHSMGAQLAFELVRRLRRAGAPEPSCLIVSSRRAPQCPGRDKPLYSLPEAEFREEIRRMNGTPEEALSNPELMDIVSPVLRADFTAIETWDYQAGQPLTAPVLALGGVHDRQVSLDDLEAWRQITVGSFSLELFSGDHFFLNQVEASLLKSMNRVMSELMPRAEVDSITR